MTEVNSAARTAAWRALSGRLTTFQALSYRNYRLLWLGQLGSSASMWMEQVARPWLIVEMTNSAEERAAMLGLIMATRMVPMLVFGLLAGVVADRFDRLKVLLICQVATMAVHLITAALVLSGTIQIWHVFVTAFFMGTAMAFNQPARQALIPSLVDKEHLTNAIALNTVAMNIMRIGGVSLGGILIATLGLGLVYTLNGVLFIWVVITTQMIQVPAHGKPLPTRDSMWTSLTDGLRYAARNPVAFAAIALAMSIFVFGLPYQSVFIPTFAKDVLDIGSTGMGFLMATTGAGALLGALTVASITRFRKRGRLLIAGVSIFGLGLIAFSLTAEMSLMPLAYLSLMAVGALQTAYMSLNNTVLLESSPPEMHGRMMSPMSLDRGLIPLGGMIAGFLAAFTGPVLGLIIFGSLCIATASLVTIFVPAVRKID